jgi:D-isomer specific 2-hydroxyacid dehydrogenase-like protein
MKVLVVDSIATEGLAYLREHGCEVDELARPKPEVLYASIGEYDALVTRSLTAVTPELLRHAPRLRIVGRAGVGVDNIDVDACSRHLGANFSEAQVNVALDVARQIVAFRDGELVEFGVNIPVADPAAVGELRPFIVLAERLGRFLVQLDPAHLANVKVTLARVVELRDLNIEFAPEGDILVLSCEDRPGMFGRIGSILGSLNVNTRPCTSSSTKTSPTARSPRSPTASKPTPLA